MGVLLAFDVNADGPCSIDPAFPPGIVFHRMKGLYPFLIGGGRLRQKPMFVDPHMIAVEPTELTRYDRVGMSRRPHQLQFLEIVRVAQLKPFVGCAYEHGANTLNAPIWQTRSAQPVTRFEAAGGMTTA